MNGPPGLHIVPPAPAPTSVAEAGPRPLTRQRLDDAHRALLHRRSRLVGWGSGSVFDFFQRRFPVRLDYVVDNDDTRWNTTRHGVPVVSPATLAHEAGNDVFVIIYSSAWPEIQQQLSTIVDLPSLAASAVFADGSARAALHSADRLAATAPRRVARDRTSAIVVQGPVLPYTTAYVVRAMSARHPDATLVLSTWDDTSSDLLDAVRPWTDDVVLSPRPPVAGIQNRNLQIVSTRAGIARAIDRGATTLLKTRTDIAVLQPDIFAQAQWWTDRIGADAARRLGQRERLIVPTSYTRKYLLYHPSDLVMLGHGEDLERYWSAPLDPRSGTLLDAEWLDRPLAEVNLSGNPTESYLGLEFCRTLQRPVLGTVEDSWAFYRDSFAVVEHDWFDLLWMKHLAIPDTGLDRHIRETVTPGFWRALQTGGSATARNQASPNPHALSLRALTETAA